jgi:hypothetical protein
VQVLRNFGALSIPKSKKIAAANAMEWVVNRTCTMPPVATIPVAGLVSRWLLPDRVWECRALFTRALDAVQVPPHKGRWSVPVPHGLNRQLREGLDVNDLQRRGTTAMSDQEEATKKTTP